MSDIDDNGGNALFVTFERDTRFIRMIDKSLMPARLSIRAEVEPDAEVSETKLQEAINKVQFFLDHLLPKTVAFSIDNDTAVEMFIDDDGHNRTGNLIMITPSEPTDEMFAMLLQSKLTAITEGVLEFVVVHVKSDNAAGMSFTFAGNASEVLPDMKDWVGERSFFDKPWWDRSDVSMLDVAPPEDADLTKRPSWAQTFADFIPSMAASQESVIIRADFRPTVIDGGDDSDD